MKLGRPVSALMLSIGLAACGAIDSATKAVDDAKKKAEFAKAEVKGNVEALKKSAGDDLGEYKAVVQNLVDSSVKYVDIDADGNFSFDMDSSAFALTLIDGNSAVAGVLMSGSSIGLAAMDSLLDLGKLKAAGTNLLGLAEDLAKKVRLDSGYIARNLSLENFGLGSGSGAGPIFDRDGDGVIDLFDVDLDNNGILNDQDKEDLLLKASQLGDAAGLLGSIKMTTSLVTEYKMPEAQRMKQAWVGLAVTPKGGVSVDSIVITGPEYLFNPSTEWRYMCATCPGDNRPEITFGGVKRKGRMILAEDGGSPQWQAIVGDQSDVMSIASMKPGDVIVFNIHKGGVRFPVIRSVSWVFRKTPTLEAIRKAGGTTLYNRAQIDAFAGKPQNENPEVDSTADLEFIVNMLRGRSDDDTLPLLGFDNYEIQFIQEGQSAGGPGAQYGMGNITAHENAQYLEKVPGSNQLKVTIPASFLKDAVPAGRPPKPAGFNVEGYKIDLGMYDRSGNKTVMQIRLNLKP